MSEVARKICWEKWADPFGMDTNDMEWPGYFGTMEGDERERQRRLEENGWSHEEEEDEGHIKVKQTQMGVLRTPMGIIPLTEHTLPSKIFNFWTMHTNFRMTRQILDKLDSTDGVESLDVYTPYRWRIAIGKAFDTNAVKAAIQENLGVTVPTEDSNNAQENV